MNLKKNKILLIESVFSKNISLSVQLTDSPPYLIRKIEWEKNGGDFSEFEAIEPLVSLKQSLNLALKALPFDFPDDYLDFSSLSPKEITVLHALKSVPCGKTVSYQELTQIAGLTPSHARFIGNVMAKNPFLLLFPCHRVIQKNGSLGNYSGGGQEIKKILLEIERRK